MFNFLTHDDIYLVNQLTVKKHGGNYVPPKNLLNAERLDYLVGMAQMIYTIRPFLQLLRFIYIKLLLIMFFKMEIKEQDFWQC